MSIDERLAVGISVVIPAYNSEKSLRELVARLEPVLEAGGDPFELILVDDGSKDGSWRTIEALSDEYSWVVGVRLSRNYGQHNALLAGIRDARYSVTITMDDDLEHRPESIPDLLALLTDDVDLVYGSPEVENHSFGRNIASRVAKRSMAIALGSDMADRASAFRLFRTRLRDGFTLNGDPFVSIDVLLSWTTTRVAVVRIPFDQRIYGSSNYTVRALIRHALNIVTGYSSVPLRLTAWIGFGAAAIGFLSLIYVLGAAFINGVEVPGFAFVACSVALFSGAQLLALGLIGEYLGRMHFRSMGRPVYTVARSTRSGADRAAGSAGTTRAD